MREVIVTPLLADGSPDPARPPIHLNAYMFTLTEGDLPVDDTPTPPVRPTRKAMTELETQIERLRSQLDEEQDRSASNERRLREALEAAVAERDDWRAARVVDAEAECISGCTRAIEALLEAKSGGRDGQVAGLISRPVGMPRYHDIDPRPIAEQTDIGRVLLNLAARYGVPLGPVVDPPVEDLVTVAVTPSVAARLYDSGDARG